MADSTQNPENDASNDAAPPARRRRRAGAPAGAPAVTPEPAAAPEDAAPSDTGPLVVMPTGSVGRLIAAGRKAPRGDDIVLRRASPETLGVHGTEVRSEALLPLDLGPGRRPALLVMGSRDVGRFSPAQGTDLLRFFAQVFRLVLIGWLRG